nr:hypothetical protein [Angustibacter aerolatus]
MTEPNLADVWQGTVSTLGDAGLTAQQRAFLRLARLVGLIDSTALVAVPNDYTKDVLEQRLRAQVTDALGAQARSRGAARRHRRPQPRGRRPERRRERPGSACSADRASKAPATAPPTGSPPSTCVTASATTVPAPGSTGTVAPTTPTTRC